MGEAATRGEGICTQHTTGKQIMPAFESVLGIQNARSCLIQPIRCAPPANQPCLLLCAHLLLSLPLSALLLPAVTLCPLKAHLAHLHQPTCPPPPPHIPTLASSKYLAAVRHPSCNQAAMLVNGTNPAGLASALMLAQHGRNKFQNPASLACWLNTAVHQTSKTL